VAIIESLPRPTVAEMRQNLAVLPGLRGHPFRFLARYVRRHPLGHAVVFGSVLLAVGCGVGTQYGMKHLVDVVSRGPQGAGVAVWWAFGLLCALVASDNLLWRVGGYSAARTYVKVTGDIRADLFAYLSGHSPSYFAERLPGALAGRISAASNAAFAISNTGSWNVLPPSIAVVCAISLIATVNPFLALTLVGFSTALGGLVFWLARQGTPLHRTYAEKAAAVDGELVDVVSNFQVVRAFGATFREQHRIGRTVQQEMDARRHSLFYMENLRLIHAVLTVLASAGVIAWGILLWQAGQASVGDIVLVTSLACSILHCTRDLAVALVDMTQHVARLEEAIRALLTPHELPDRADARALLPGAGQVTFEAVNFAYPQRAPVLRGFDLGIAPGQRVGLVGASGAGKSTVLALLQRFYDVSGGRVLIDGQDISAVTQDSLRQTMAIVPQDISLFHRSVLENIRYARPGATEAEVLAAAEMAYCREFIEALPDCFATMVGERGV
jgi:ATP-binding cassette subfamily B protein